MLLVSFILFIQKNELSNEYKYDLNNINSFSPFGDVIPLNICSKISQ